MNYVLIGMPGSGKSTMGVLRAKYIGFGFVDCDLMIQSREKKLLSEIIETEGVERFIEIENDVISCLCVDRCIIATGGSAVYGEEAMAHLKENGTVIYLNTFSGTIAPSIRIGYLLLPVRLAELFNQKLGFYSCTVPILDQYFLAELLKSGDFERHINRLRRLKRKSVL